MTVAAGFVPDFKGTDTLLFLCDRDGAKSLRRFFHQIAEDGRPITIEIGPGIGVQVAPHQRIIVDCVAKMPVEGTETVIEHADGQTTWTLSLSHVKDCALRLAGVAAAPAASHTYLEDDSDIQVVVSMDEYPFEMFDRVGMPERTS